MRDITGCHAEFAYPPFEVEFSISGLLQQYKDRKIPIVIGMTFRFENAINKIPYENEIGNDIMCFFRRHHE